MTDYRVEYTTSADGASIAYARGGVGSPVVAVPQNVGSCSPGGFRGTGVDFREMDSALRKRMDQIYQQKLEEVARTSD